MISALTIFLLVASAGDGGQAKPDSFNDEGYFACISEELYDEAMKAAIRRDLIALADAMKRGCVIPKAGTHVLLLETGWGFGPVKVRVYAKGGSVVLWTTIKALNIDLSPR